MRPDHVIVVGGVNYPIRFGQNALFLLESELMAIEAKSVAAGAKPKTRTITIPSVKGQKPRSIDLPVTGLDLLAEMPNVTSVQLMFWAGLESARMRNRPNDDPYTITAVGEIIDEAGGVENIMIDVMRAYSQAFPKKLKPETIDAMQKQAEEDAKKEKEADLKNGQAEESIGTASSSKDSKPASRKTNSGK